MIVPMKKVTLLCLKSDREHALEILRNLGSMHLAGGVRAESEDFTALRQKANDCVRIFNILSGVKPGKSAGKILSGEELLKQSLHLLEEKSSLEKEIETLKAEIEQLTPWGDFAPEQLSELRKNGVHILFCSVFRNQFPEIAVPENVILKEISRTPKEVFFLLISQEALDESQYPVVKLPGKPLSCLRKTLSEKEAVLASENEKLSMLALQADSLKELLKSLNGKLEFAAARDGMISDGELAYLTGYVPVPEMERLTETARVSGWAILAEDPEADDAQVPTCIEKPSWLKIIDPLFDFIGIAPGYREYDVSLFFLIAFPVFFGMLIGDAGYGTLFLMTAFLCKYLFRKNTAAQMPLNLMILLSCFSVLNGVLYGSVFGLPRNTLPVFLQGIDFLAEPESSPAACALAKRLNIANPADLGDKFTQWFCFLLAALHLMSARVYKTVLEWRNWRSFGNLGWAMVICGNFFTAVSLVVFPGTFPMIPGMILYGLGFLLIVVTIEPMGLLNLPFSLVGSFVDVLSYIRLFAVGLSGVYVATCFNSMAKMVFDAMPKELAVLGLILLIVVAVLGHVLNILLGFMGVMVHAVRLNTLEFSNHIEMQWAGIRYAPFADKEKISENNKHKENEK